MEEEGLAAGLQIIERADFETIEGGEPDLFWKPTQVLALKTARGKTKTLNALRVGTWNELMLPKHR